SRDDRHLRGPRYGPALRLLRGPGAAGPAPPPGRGRDGPATDPGGDEQPGDVRLSPRLGDGQSDLPDGLQPQTHPEGDAAARLDARATRAPPARAASPRPDPAGGVGPAVVLGCLLDSLLERRSALRSLRHRLPRSGSPGLRRLAPLADGRGHPHPDGPHAVAALGGGHAEAPDRGLYAHQLGLVPITTPAYSPESNGLAEAFVGTFKRDYLGDAELRDA